MGSPRQTNYIVYGKEHEAELKQQFVAEMFSNSTSRRWLSTGTTFRAIPDLGYFMGYSICVEPITGKRKISSKQAIQGIIRIELRRHYCYRKFSPDFQLLYFFT